METVVPAGLSPEMALLRGDCWEWSEKLDTLAWRPNGGW